MILRYHLGLVRMAVINKSDNQCWQGYGEKGTFVEKQINTPAVEISLETSKIKIRTTICPAISLLGTDPENSTLLQWYLHPQRSLLLYCWSKELESK